jgi:hypothetical protein
VEKRKEKAVMMDVTIACQGNTSSHVLQSNDFLLYLTRASAHLNTGIFPQKDEYSAKIETWDRFEAMVKSTHRL